MPDRRWKSKGETVPRRSPGKRGKTCGRPFKAPRAVVEEKDSDVQLVGQEIAGENDSQVQLITETQNKRDLEGRVEAEPSRVNPYPRGIKLMSEREATECAKHGEVLRWSSEVTLKIQKK